MNLASWKSLVTVTKEVWGSGCGVMSGAKSWLVRNSDVEAASRKRVREIDPGSINALAREGWQNIHSWQEMCRRAEAKHVWMPPWHCGRKPTQSPPGQWYGVVIGEWDTAWECCRVTRALKGISALFGSKSWRGAFSEYWCYWHRNKQVEVDPNISEKFIDVKIIFQFSEIIMYYQVVLMQLALHLEENKDVPPSYTKHKRKF